MISSPDNFLFTSESVTEGHPDKVADQISDAVLDAILEQDRQARVACETLVTTGLAFIAGEITTDCYADLPTIVRETLRNIGYTSSELGFDADTCGVISSIDKQSADIAAGLSRERPEQQGAGDQGMMSGFATQETQTLMPAPIYYAHKLAQRLTHVRKENILDFLRPDGKTEVSIEYENGLPKRIANVIIACQHDENINYSDLEEAVKNKVIRQALPLELLDRDTRFFINSTGRFVIGGPVADCGQTGRKIIQDTYGSMGNHGGGAFSGKDPSKVDRSAGYMARYIAKNIVAADLASRCEIQIAYVIGIAEPISIFISTGGTGKIPDRRLTAAVREVFDLRPYHIIRYLDLLRPIYKKTSCYGHFGREDEDFPWEKTDAVQDLLTACKV